MKKKVAQWETDGRPMPPPHAIKQQVIKEYANRYGLKVLVESGTFMGDMVEAMRTQFETIFTIELSGELFERAQKRFRGYPHIRLIHGDSGRELAGIIAELHQPALFWLDGHYSEDMTAKGEKETPIFEELTHIFNAAEQYHVIIIDDARSFGVDTDYPTIEELVAFVKRHRPHASITIDNDSIRITPKQ